jgi:biopolymer transport protein ExbB
MPDELANPPVGTGGQPRIAYQENVMSRRWWITLYTSATITLMAATAWAQEEAADPGAEIEISVLDHFVKKGGFITYGILIPLSILMVALVVEHAIKIRRKRMIPPDLHQRIRELFEQRKFRDVLDLTNDEPSDLGHVINAALAQAGSGFAAMERALEEALDQRTARLFRKIELLNTIGNVSPMIGLFGTVFGMIVAFQTLVESGGQPDPGKLAAGISVALVTTFWGLLVGIPALTAFAIFRNRVDGLTAECAITADELLMVFKPGSGRGPGTAQQPPAPKPAPAPRGQTPPPRPQNSEA